MNADDLRRFAEDLRLHAGLTVDVCVNTSGTGMHLLRINGVDFFFYVDRGGYDGWGQALSPAPRADAENSNKSETSSHSLHFVRKGEGMNNEHKPVRIVIFVEGGIVQDVLTDTENVEAMIVDYDNEDVGEPKDSRSFESVPVNRECIEKTIQGIED